MAARENFQFIICPILSSVPVGELSLSDVEWNRPVYGAGAGFTGKAAVTRTQTRERLIGLTEPDAVALYVKDVVNGTYLFGGPLYANPWSMSDSRLVLQAHSWKAWLYQKLCGMSRSTNPVGDRVFSWTNTDQFAIARNLISAVLTGEVGCPTIKLGSELSGVPRDMNLHAWDQRYLAQQIDTMANRDNGFEWDIDIRPNALGNPELWFVPSYPTRGGLNNQILLLHQAAEGGNILKVLQPEATAGDRRSRVWTTGPGKPPDQMVAYDQDPALDSGSILLRETVTNYNNGISKITTLADHARTERIYRSKILQQVALEVAIDKPDFRQYESGDKVRLKVKDKWIDWDFTSVRILDRTMKINRNEEPDIANLLIDLNDTELPENEAVV